MALTLLVLGASAYNAHRQYIKRTNDSELLDSAVPYVEGDVNSTTPLYTNVVLRTEHPINIDGKLFLSKQTDVARNVQHKTTQVTAHGIYADSKVVTTSRVTETTEFAPLSDNQKYLENLLPAFHRASKKFSHSYKTAADYGSGRTTGTYNSIGFGSVHNESTKDLGKERYVYGIPYDPSGVTAPTYLVAGNFASGRFIDNNNLIIRKDAVIDDERARAHSDADYYGTTRFVLGAVGLVCTVGELYLYKKYFSK